jgi:hypothetical protein
MEKRLITLALSGPSFDEACVAFEQDRWIQWDFPDYVIKLELDRSISEGVILRHDGRRHESRVIMDYTFPSTYFPDDITHLVRLAYAEAIRCYENACFLASVALCGRTIETVLGALYEKKVGIHPSKDTNKPGMNAILNRLSKEGFAFPVALKERMEIIALHRNMAVHGNLTVPSEDEARSVVYTTRDVLQTAAR